MLCLCPSQYRQEGAESYPRPWQPQVGFVACHHGSCSTELPLSSLSERQTTKRLACPCVCQHILICIRACVHLHSCVPVILEITLCERSVVEIYQGSRFICHSVKQDFRRKCKLYSPKLEKLFFIVEFFGFCKGSKLYVISSYGWSPNAHMSFDI